MEAWKDERVERPIRLSPNRNNWPRRCWETVSPSQPCADKDPTLEACLVRQNKASIALGGAEGPGALQLTIKAALPARLTFIFKLVRPLFCDRFSCY
jgi:hypothetical protein